MSDATTGGKTRRARSKPKKATKGGAAKKRSGSRSRSRSRSRK
jgi:hypothetical protein